MRLTAFILLTTCLTAAAAGHSQGVTLNIKDAPLEKVFNEIRKQTGYNFLFSSKELKAAGKISLQVSNASIEQILTLCFKDKPFTYTIQGNSIVISKRSEKIPNDNSADETSPITNHLSLIDITGRVTDADGNPLAGASVKVKGSSIGTTTNADGVFTLKGVNENATLEISFVGYETYTIAVVNKTSIAASLKLKPESLNEVVINKGYYTEKQRLSTGNVSQVTSKDIEKQPVQNPILALQGRVPGITITQANGISGGAVTVRILGQNSINSGNEPFYIVDGVPYVSLMLPTTGIGNILGGSRATYNGSGNPLNYINPNDIESIEVLKDADATAIYGSRAANGAILITTKKGKAGNLKADINLQQGWGKVTRMLDLMNTKEYLQMRHEAIRNDNSVISPTDYDINGFWDTTRYTDWQKAFIGNTSKFSNFSGSISGGSDNSRYLITGTYNRQTSVFPGDFSDQRGALHFNLNSSSINQRFRVEFSGSYLVDKNLLPNADLTSVATTLAPNAPALYSADGSLNWAVTPTGTSSWGNPLDVTLQEYENKTTSLVSNLVLNYRIISGLEIKGSAGFTKLQSDEFVGNPLISIRPEDRPTTQRYSLFNNSNINSWILEPQINYNKTFGRSKISALIGTTFQKFFSEGEALTTSGYNNDAILKNIRAASSITVNTTVASTYKYSALFGRLNYNFDDKYVINLTARRDGSSRFGPENQFQNFGAIGLGWIFTQEQFIRNGFPILSFGKLKGSIGTTGNDQIGDYKFMSLYNTVGVAVPYQGITTLEPSGLYNPALQWETKRSVDLGIELGFLNDRIFISSNYSLNRSSNQLIGYIVPLLTGFATVARNFDATVQNRVWEFVLNTSNLKSSELSWKSSFNITIPNNKLIEFKNLETSSYASDLVLGESLNIAKVYHYLGVDPLSGRYNVETQSGHPTFSPSNSDKKVIIQTAPKFYGGLQNTFSYKKLQLDFLFQFVKQTGQNYFGGYTVPGGYRVNQPRSVLGRWQKSGDNTSVQRFNSTYSLFDSYSILRTSDKAYSDASFVRLKNISVSYQIPTKSKLQNCRLFLQGQNMFTITKFDGLDPETGNNSLPPLKILTVGLQVTF